MPKESWLTFKNDPLIDENLLLEPPPVHDQLEADWSMLRGREDPVPEGTVPRMTDQKLKGFIRSVLNGTVFTSRHIHQHLDGACLSCKLSFPNIKTSDRCPNCQQPFEVSSRPNIDYGMVFLPLALGALSQFLETELPKIGGFYAAYADALPRSINGYPIFLTVGIIHILDWEKAWRVIDREIRRQENLDLENI